MTAEAEKLKKGAQRLQSGLAMVGLVHDLAHHAHRVSTWASQLREPLKRLSVQAGIPQTVDDMVSSAEIVGRLTSVMDSLTLSSGNKISKVNVRSQLEKLAPILEMLDKRISTSFKAHVVVKGPASFVERIVFNLVVNSLHWVDKENGHVQVTLTDDDGVAVLSVIDNGQGMSPERQALATHPFESGRESGSGLGLYVVNQICREVGASLKISSTEYQGTTVRVRFIAREG